MSDRADTARKMKQAGKTYAQIGAELGISRQRAQQLVRPSDRVLAEKKIIAGGRCQKCGKEAKKLEGHHSDYGSDDVIMLCTSCHKKADTELRNEKLDKRMAEWGGVRYIWSKSILPRLNRDKK
jgi:hypothetical protein